MYSLAALFLCIREAVRPGNACASRLVFALFLSAGSAHVYAQDATPSLQALDEVVVSAQQPVRVQTLASSSTGAFFQVEYRSTELPAPAPAAVLRIRTANTLRSDEPPGRVVDEIALSYLMQAGPVLTVPVTTNYAEFVIVGGTGVERVGVIARGHLVRLGLVDRAPTAGISSVEELRLNREPGAEVQALIRASDSVAALQIGGAAEPPYCTAFLAEQPNLIITAAHCLKNSAVFMQTAQSQAKKCTDVIALFSYFSSDPNYEAVRCADVILYHDQYANPPDLAVLRLSRPTLRNPLPLRRGQLEGNAVASVLHHPAGRVMRASMGCELLRKGEVALLHRCTTLAASSGAPIFMFQPTVGPAPELRVIGLHQGDDGNFRRALEAIAEQLIERCKPPISANCVIDRIYDGVTAISAEGWQNRGIAASSFADLVSSLARAQH